MGCPYHCWVHSKAMNLYTLIKIKVTPTGHHRSPELKEANTIAE